MDTEGSEQIVASKEGDSSMSGDLVQMKSNTIWLVVLIIIGITVLILSFWEEKRSENAQEDNYCFQYEERRLCSCVMSRGKECQILRGFAGLGERQRTQECKKCNKMRLDNVMREIQIKEDDERFLLSLRKLVDDESDIVSEYVGIFLNRDSIGRLIPYTNEVCYRHFHTYHIINKQSDKLLICHGPESWTPLKYLEIINFLYGFGSVVVYRSLFHQGASRFEEDAVAVWTHYAKKYGAQNIILLGNKGGCQTVAGVCSYLSNRLVPKIEYPLAIILDEPVIFGDSNIFGISEFRKAYRNTDISNTIFLNGYQTFSPFIKVIILHNVMYPTQYAICKKNHAQEIAKSLMSYHPWVHYIETKGPAREFVVNDQFAEILSSLCN